MRVEGKEKWFYLCFKILIREDTVFSDMENIFQLVESIGLTEKIMIASFPDWVFISQLLVFSELMKDHFVYKLVNFNLALVTI